MSAHMAEQDAPPAAPMRLLHVIAGAPVGGAETFAQDAILALHGRGLWQRVICRPYPALKARFIAARLEMMPFAFSLADRLRGRGRVIRAAAQEADLVHAWMSRANSFIPARMPCPVIGWFGDYYDLKYFRRADCFFCVTPDIARHVIANGAPPHRVFMLNTFGTMPEAARISRAALDTPADARVLLVLARLHGVKGIDTMLEALVRLPDCTLWVAGDGPERASLEALAARLGVDRRVRFLGWRGDRKALLEAADICVLPSRYEPFGTVIVEAWAAGRPLVATRADGARQYVRDGENGLLCPIDDVTALASCLRRVLDEPGLAARLIAGGSAAYQADFTREIVTDRLLAAYSRCLELGERRFDTLVEVADLDPARLDALKSAAGGGPHAAALAAVALAHGARGATAARLEAAWPGALLRERGRRVLCLDERALDHSAALLPTDAGQGVPDRLLAALKVD